jgi:hypothetical protein
MGFTVDPTLPANTEAIGGGLGASRIRNITSWLLQMFGYSGSTAQTIISPPFGFDINNLVTVQSNPISPTGIATKQYVDAAGSTVATISNGGSGSAFTGTLVPAITAYALLAGYAVKWTQASQGADTIAFNGLPPLAVKKNSGGALVNLAAGDIPAGSTTELIYDGTNLQIAMGPVPSVAGLLTQARGSAAVFQTLTNTAVLTNATGLVFPIAANEWWSFTFILNMTLGAGGFDVGIAAPAGSAVNYAFASSYVSANNGAKLAGAIGGTSGLYVLNGIVTNGATAGSVQLQFCQDTSNAAATTINYGSAFVATRQNP